MDITQIFDFLSLTSIPIAVISIPFAHCIRIRKGMNV